MQSFIQTLPNSNISFKMIKVEGGVFDMGGESWTVSSLPVHPVDLSDFWIAEHLVTQELWEAILGKEKNESCFKGKRRPVERVSWEQISDEFLPALNELTKGKRPIGTIFQLPTEAQWEYAARGGKLSNGFLYSGSNKLDDVGWYAENSNIETKPVGLKMPNELGLYDMSGNLWEWCRDCHSINYYNECIQEGVKKDPDGPIESFSHVLRGGGWNFFPRNCRVADRYGKYPAFRDDNFGFRLALVSLPV